ncbi:MAG: hypothetical protein L6R37_007454 [Teloschistes peruensis]|nr:MAG: hypothetical protein L6R37_007454 [Teloschistes peruensis]
MGELTTSSANTSVDLPGTAVDKDRHEDVNDESDDQDSSEETETSTSEEVSLYARDTSNPGAYMMDHYKILIGEPCDEAFPTLDIDFEPIQHDVSYALQIAEEISNHTKHIKNLRSLLQDQIVHCCEVAVEEGCHLPDHGGDLVKLNKEISALLSKAIGWENQMAVLDRDVAQKLSYATEVDGHP